jgi:cysteine-rich repeat protein
MKTLSALATVLLTALIATGCGADGYEDDAAHYDFDDDAVEFIDSIPEAEIAPYCGDGSVGEAEECDDATANDDFGACTHECSINICGDGLVFEGAEQCDDGELNGTGDTLCSADCTLPV